MLFDDEIEDTDELFAEPEKPEGKGGYAPEPNTIKPPREQPDLIAHADVEKKILDMLSTGRIPQSLIFTGPNGVGKSTMAFRLARYLFRHDGKKEEGGLFGGFEPEPPPPTSLFVAASDLIAQQVASGGYPDMKVVERIPDEKGKLKAHDLEEVRAVASFFRKTASTDGGWRVAIIDDADTMTWAAQNALLKILEEPPQRSLLILISHRIGAMLPTILSRAIVINFQPLSDDNIRNILHQYGGPLTDETLTPRIVGMSAGSIGKALYYAEEGRREIIAQTLAPFADWPKFDWVNIQMFAETIGGKGTDESAQAVFRDTLLWFIARLAKAKATGQAPPPELRGPGLSLMLERISLQKLILVSDALKAHFDEVQSAHLDKRFMVMQAYSLLNDQAA